MEVDKDTVNHWLPILGRHGQGVMNYFFRNLHLGECQLDELWTFIYKFVVPHRGLRQRWPRALPTKGRKGSYKKWKLVIPAMAAGLTDHVWTMDELLSFRVPPKSLW